MKANTILLVYPVDFSKKENKGISHKSIGQKSAFNSLDYEVKSASICQAEGIISFQEGESHTTKSFLTSKSQYFLKLHSFYMALREHINDVDIIYIRHLLHTPSLYEFLKAAHSKGKTIIYEYPTLPYRLEWTKWWQRLLVIMDQYYLDRCENLKDLVVHYGGYEGENENIRISNGIQVLNHPINRSGVSSASFRLVAIGRWEYWHGLDRVFKGIAKSSQDIHIKVIGIGPMSDSYKLLVDKLNISKKVTFHPPTFGSDLADLIGEADLGVSTLGLHRKGVLMDSSLKSRTYCALGLPFIHASEDLDFPDELPFTFRVSTDDSIINLDKVMEEYKQREKDHSAEFSTEAIRRFAFDNLTWSSRAKKIHDKIVHLRKLH